MNLLFGPQGQVLVDPDQADNALHNHLAALTSAVSLLLEAYAAETEPLLHTGLTPDQRHSVQSQLGSVRELQEELLRGGLEVGFYLFEPQDTPV